MYLINKVYYFRMIYLFIFNNPYLGVTYLSLSIWHSIKTRWLLFWFAPLHNLTKQEYFCSGKTDRIHLNYQILYYMRYFLLECIWMTTMDQTHFVSSYNIISYLELSMDQCANKERNICVCVTMVKVYMCLYKLYYISYLLWLMGNLLMHQCNENVRFHRHHSHI